MGYLMSTQPLCADGVHRAPHRLTGWSTPLKPGRALLVQWPRQVHGWAGLRPPGSSLPELWSRLQGCCQGEAPQTLGGGAVIPARFFNIHAITQKAHLTFHKHGRRFSMSLSLLLPEHTWKNNPQGSPWSETQRLLNPSVWGIKGFRLYPFCGL